MNLHNERLNGAALNKMVFVTAIASIRAHQLHEAGDPVRNRARFLQHPPANLIVNSSNSSD